MEPLAVLPVFLNLQGKRVALLGGTEAAAWKAELLAASGAHVEVYAPTLEPEMEALLARDLPAGSLQWHERPWALDAFANAACVVADAADEAEAKAMVCAARGAGVPINVIDMPAYCQFQFGSIVNRSPVVVSISTAGAAPILGQAIRRRIETLLPRALQGWAGLAQTVRAQVLQRFGPGAPRRAFWERFVDRAFSGDGAPAQLDVASLVADDGNRAGRVTLVGAGPGDAELLTLKAVRALQSADVILFDDLISDDVLELARREAKRMMVGKRGGRDSCRQDDINALMIKLAKQGKHVVRLKSGDPSVFGRAGEELASLRVEGIACTVVPGITAASAMASRLGVSLTHRDHAQCVSFVTGHSKRGSLPEGLDYDALIGEGRSAVVYMGARTAGDLTASLLAKGVPGSLPAVVMQSVCRPEETVWHGSLDTLPAGCASMVADGPVLIALGTAFAQAKPVAAPQTGTQTGDAFDTATVHALAI
ncbi:MAG: siroheme synthase CysG [Devosiaceae bacterium]|nr:siroheme synthase CysG [Devosiaceae bacterium MH13]